MKVSVIIPCRNEARFIAACLDSLVDQDLSKDLMEVIVVDGMSTDGTIPILEEYAARYPFIRFIPNPKKITPVAFNLGFTASSGTYVGYIGAHATYEPTYISTLISYLETHEVDCVGGLRINIPRESTYFGNSWTLAVTHPFGVGDSLYNTGSNEAREADTAACSFYPRTVFDRIGLFNEHLVHSQDMELNRRLKQQGGKIILHPRVSSIYFTRTEPLEVIRYTYKNGKWAILPYTWCKNALSIRHLVPLVFVSGIAVGGLASIFFMWMRVIYFALMALYIVLALMSATQLCRRAVSWKYFPLLPIQFFMQHFFYGVGSIVGVVKVLLTREFYSTQFSN